MHNLLEHVLSDLAALARGTRPRGGAGDTRLADEAALGEIVDLIRSRSAVSHGTASRKTASADAAIDAALVGQVASLYRKLGVASGTRHHLLRLLAAAGGRTCLEA